MPKRYQMCPEQGEMESYHYEPQRRADPEGKIRTAAYCRVSTLAEEQDESFTTQCTYYENVITKDPDKVLVGIYGDQGKSGLRTEKRVGFKKMIKDAMEGRIDLILVKSLSRFSRNMADCLNYLHLLKEKNIEVRFEKEGLSSLDPMTEMVLNMYASIAQNESCSISENIRWAMKKRAEAGDPIRRTVYGYRSRRQLLLMGENPDKDVVWQIVPEEAERVRLMFTMAAAGSTPTAICTALNQMEEEKGSEYRWQNARIREMIMNEAYRGDILTAKSVQLDYVNKLRVDNTGQADQFYIEDHHVPIVDGETFEQANEKLKAYLSGCNVNRKRGVVGRVRGQPKRHKAMGEHETEHRVGNNLSTAEGRA